MFVVINLPFYKFARACIFTRANGINVNTGFDIRYVCHYCLVFGGNLPLFKLNN